jgi:hypothetical protein
MHDAMGQVPRAGKSPKVDAFPNLTDNLDKHPTGPFAGGRISDAGADAILAGLKATGKPRKSRKYKTELKAMTARYADEVNLAHQEIERARAALDALAIMERKATGYFWRGVVGWFLAACFAGAWVWK